MHRHTAAALLLLTMGAAAPARPAGAQDGALFRTDMAAAPLSPSAAFQDGYGAPRDDRRGGLQEDGQRGPSVRVWLDGDRDLFSPGAQTRAVVRASEDAYVAVVHITPDGDVDFLWPRNYYDDGFLDGGRSLTLGTRTGSSMRVGYGYGIGYVFAVASDEPLDLRRVRDYYYRRGSAWDAGLNVVGDPFHAMDRIARLLVPDFDQGYGFLDWYSYHVGSNRYTFPRYACYSSYGSWYGSRSPYYDGCDRVRVLLREQPYYYDTRYYRGDRIRYWGRYYPSDRYVRREPQHRYKESDGARGYRSPNNRSTREVPPPSSGSTRRGNDDGQEGRGGGGTQQPSRERPTLQRRPAESDPVRAQQPRAEPQRRRDEPRDDGSRGESRREAPRSEPRSEPRRESPPPRSEPRSEQPRRESPPPSREPSSGGRSAPSGNSPARVRPSS
ncbi:DUF4384 domain-containing protein [Longimicrobium sp.]|uniref:DUF4384 domain-containing protein n=1 Tax=Longimicrobium sp. TaxID=2029185 RepID=UPI002B585E80|nr:DUF4384 domain-containing protein [Longimicrobium sp.]HSU16239.1 DUF4384 domain-containing protein [Longimicrobium sp.]